MKQRDFLEVVKVSWLHLAHPRTAEAYPKAFVKISVATDDLLGQAEQFASQSVAGLLRTMPDLSAPLEAIQAKYQAHSGGRSVLLRGAVQS